MNIPNHEKDSKAGSVLLMALGILAVISLLGTAVYFMAKQEDAHATAFMDETRAQFAADSGVEHSISKIWGMTDSPLYYSERMAALPQNAALSLEFVRQSSFGSLDTDGDGFKDAAGFVSETYGEKGDLYRLRVESSQAKLNINDTNTPVNEDSDPYEDQMMLDRNYDSLPSHLKHPSGHDPDWFYPGQGGYDASKSLQPNKPYPKAQGRLWIVTKELLDILFPNLPLDANGKSIGERGADAIFSARRANPADRFSDPHEIEDVMVPSLLSAEQFRLFRSHLTLDSWQDKNVLKPSFQWRVNTPGPIDETVVYQLYPDWYGGPSLFLPPAYPGFAPDTRHPTYLPGDMVRFMLEGFGVSTRRPCHRPGADENFAPGSDLTGVYKYDFNFDGIIQDPDGNNPYSYHEWVRHDHDIYQYSDMQTKYFSLEARSPVDVNAASIELLQALISPLRGWYLKEAPSVWDGEDPRARAEDWSQPNGSMLNIYVCEGGYPWWCIPRIGMAHALLTFGYSFESSMGLIMPDKSQYYFYDSYAKDYARWNIDPDDWADGWGTWEFVPECANKSARYGELTETKSFKKILSTDASQTVAFAIALAIYDRVHPDADSDGLREGYNPFATMEEFENFILDLVDYDGLNDLPGSAKDFDIYMAHALIANFNPNSRVNDYNPNKRFYLHVDKSQLIANSTEFCFHPMGKFDIRSRGEIRKGSGTAATRDLYCGIQCMELFRVTQQSQFLRNRNPLAGAGDFFSESNSSNPTAGSRAGCRGYALQSYPEPLLETADYGKDSVYDGFLALATFKPDIGDLFSGDTANTVLYSNFDDGLNAEMSVGNPNIQPDSPAKVWVKDPWRYKLYWLPGIPGVNMPLDAPSIVWPLDPTAQVPGNNPSTKRLTRGFDDLHHANDLEDKPGTLHPDGALSDVGRSIRYETANNIGNASVGGRIGSLQFWLKPNFDATHSNRVRKFFTAPPRGLDPTSGHLDFGPGMIWDVPPFHGFFMGSPGNNWDTTRDFSLYYFARGGRRVVPSDPNDPNSPMDDEVNLSYDASYSLHDGRWLPTRSFFFHADELWYDNSAAAHVTGVGSSSANQDWRSVAEINPAYPEYNFESHQWTHIALSWDWVGDGGLTPPLHQITMSLNGKTIGEDRERMPEENQHPDLSLEWQRWFGGRDYPLKNPLYYRVNGYSNYVGFGGSSSDLWMNDVADSTFDDIVSSARQQSIPTLEEEFGFGRYYDGNDAEYTSPAFNIFRELSTSAKSLELISIAWTAYWPHPANSNRSADHPRFNDNLSGIFNSEYNSMEGLQKGENDFPMDPMVPHWGGNWIPFSVDIVNPSNNRWRYREEFGSPKSRMPNYAGGSRDENWLDQPLIWKKGQREDLRFRVNFNIKEGQTLFSTPIFDDISFLLKMDEAKATFWCIE